MIQMLDLLSIFELNFEVWPDLSDCPNTQNNKQNWSVVSIWQHCVKIAAFSIVLVF